MNIIIVDRNGTRRQGVCDSLLKAVPHAKIFQHDGETAWTNSSPSSMLIPDAVFSHLSDMSAWKRHDVKATITNASVRICFSTVGLSEKAVIPTGWLPLPRPLLDRTSLSEEEWRELAEWILRFDVDLASVPRVLRRAMEEPLAFRLLCDAASTVSDENRRRRERGEAESHTAELSDITIHAPLDLGQWLAPFGVSEDDALPHLARLIVESEKVGSAETVKSALASKSGLREAVQIYLDETFPLPSR